MTMTDKERLAEREKGRERREREGDIHEKRCTVIYDLAAGILFTQSCAFVLSFVIRLD